MEDKLILVTGANGYTAAHVVQQLLLAGCRVRGSIRSLKDQNKVSQLMKLVPNSKHKLELVEALLTNEEGWDAAVSGCWAVIHTIGITAKFYEFPTEEEYMAIEYHGKLRVLRAAAKAGVKKFVCTSDFVTVLGIAVPLDEDKVYTEDDWTDPDFPNLDVSSKVKILGEKAAWDFVNALPEDEKMDLTVILPVGSVGPPLIITDVLNGSCGQISLLFNRTVPGCPHVQVLSCDVRDVAAAHIKSLTTPEAVGKRIITSCGESLWVSDVAKILAQEFTPQGYSIYTNTLPNFLVRVPTFFFRKLAATSNMQRLGKRLSVSNKRMVEILGIKPRNPRDSIEEQAYTMIDAGMLYKAKNYKKVGSRAKQEVNPE